MTFLSVTSNNTSEKKTLTSNTSKTFPAKLHDMMTFVESKGLDNIISWVMDGTAIMIRDPDKLVALLPFFFQQTKYRSFRRQLNMWHFDRVLDGPNRGAFTHPHFIKGEKTLCKKMSRQISQHPSKSQLVEGALTKKSLNFMEMVNFYPSAEMDGRGDHGQPTYPTNIGTVPSAVSSWSCSFQTPKNDCCCSSIDESLEPTPFKYSGQLREETSFPPCMFTGEHSYSRALQQETEEAAWPQISSIYHLSQNDIHNLQRAPSGGLFEPHPIAHYSNRNGRGDSAMATGTILSSVLEEALDFSVFDDL